MQRHAKIINNNYYLVLTSNSREKDEINKVLNHRRNISINTDNHGASIGTIGNHFIIHVTGTSGISDRYSIAAIANRILANKDFPSPKLVILTGFCWGDPKKTAVNDAVLSTAVISLNKQVADLDGVKYILRNFNSALVLDEDVMSSLAQEKGYKVKFGQLASIEMLVANSESRDKIIESCPSILGGEMEAFALIPSLANIPWLVIKTVSDTGGDDFHRDSQNLAAETSASLVSLLLPAIVSTNNLESSINEDDYVTILDDLVGKTVNIDRGMFTSDTLNDYLNDEIGPVLVRRLKKYSSAIEYDEHFPYILCGFILEMVQNSFRHGGAKKIGINFNKDNISVIEDVLAFDIRNVQNGNGGFLAWSMLKEMYIDKAEISYSVKERSQLIKLLKIDEVFRRVINHCTAQVISSTVRTGFASREVLSVNQSCNEIYVDVTKIFMMSRMLDISSDIKKFLSDGKVVYISCRDEREVDMYKSYFTDDLDKLRVFVG